MKIKEYIETLKKLGVEHLDLIEEMMEGIYLQGKLDGVDEIKKRIK